MFCEDGYDEVHRQNVSLLLVLMLWKAMWKRGQNQGRKEGFFYFFTALSFSNEIECAPTALVYRFLN